MSGRINALRVLVALAAIDVLATGCGGTGSPASNNVAHPLVRQFSPTMSPIDFNTGLANPTFTDGNLTVSTDPAFPGEIVVFFQQDTKIDPKTVFIGGNPALGIDLSAFQVLRDIPGTGLVPLAAATIIVEDDKIRFIPAALPLPDGQYSIGVFGNLKSTEGDPVQAAPVFHSFTVGATDTIPPVVVVTNPVDQSVGIGAGVPPPAPPPGVPSSSVADIRTAIFGPTTPDIIVRFSESVAASSVNASNVTVSIASQLQPGQAPVIAPAPGFPKLRSQLDHSSLPSNGFELIFRPDPATGGLPFGSQIQVAIKGADGSVSASPIKDRSGNSMVTTFTFQFQTLAPPDLPADSEPEYSIYFSTSDRIGVIDAVNQFEIGQRFIGLIPGGTLLATNQVVPRSDQISTKATLGAKFDPQEISIDTRTNGGTGHTFAYVQSFQSGQILIVNTRTSLPAAIINTPSPGGLANQTGGGIASNVLLATNSSANTYTVYNMASITTGTQYVSAPISITQVSPTGNTPRAISITDSAAYSRSHLSGGPGVPMIMYADFTDGVVSTANIGKLQPIRQFALGTGASPNDISFTPCFGLPPIMFAAISEGGTPGNGKVSYYVSGPGCLTGVSTTGLTQFQRPDSLVGDLSGFDAPAGLDCVFPVSTRPFFAMAESGSTANRIVTLGTQTGAGNLPYLLLQFDTGANPVGIAHIPSYVPPGTCGADICAYPPIAGFGCNCANVPPPSLLYGGTVQQPGFLDLSGAPSFYLYACVRGAGRVEVVNFNDGRRPNSPVRDPSQGLPVNTPSDVIPVPGVRSVNSTASQ